MKFPSLVLAVLLLLCGCAAQPQDPTAPPVTIPKPIPKPVSIYDAGSEIERNTDGAIKAYPLALSGAIGILPFGEDLLLFSGTDRTVLTLYRGEELYAAASAAVDCRIDPSDGATQVSRGSMVYHDRSSGELVTLDTCLQETGRRTLPDSIRGAPVLSSDQKKLYYCTADSLRCLDLESGLVRLVKQMQFAVQETVALHCGDAVVVCYAEEKGIGRQLYISAETGQLLHEAESALALETCGDVYFARHKDGSYTELLSGSSEHGPTMLLPCTYEPATFPLLENGSVVAATESDGAMQLDHYDLRSGRRTASIFLRGTEEIKAVAPCGDGQTIWFLRYDPSYGCDVLYKWDLSKSATEDKRSYLSARYSAEKPDYAGLAACREIADRLSCRYGVQILLWTDATSYQPWDYTLIPEYQIQLIQEGLKELEQFLAMYPAGFLEKAAELSSSGRIQICLVRSIQGNAEAENAVSEAVGLQYWDHNRNSYLCLSLQQGDLARNACHEMSHIIDSRVMTLCKAYDDWNTLNPKGFQYRGSDFTAASVEDQSLLADASRAFIDTYSMTYAKEDRARIMEYAMMEGNAGFFESEIMQKKLRQICSGIREAFDLKKSEEVFRWEQYLRS